MSVCPPLSVQVFSQCWGSSHVPNMHIRLIYRLLFPHRCVCLWESRCPVMDWPQCVRESVPANPLILHFMIHLLLVRHGAREVDSTSNIIHLYSNSLSLSLYFYHHPLPPVRWSVLHKAYSSPSESLTPPWRLRLKVWIWWANSKNLAAHHPMGLKQQRPKLPGLICLLVLVTMETLDIPPHPECKIKCSFFFSQTS